MRILKLISVASVLGMFGMAVISCGNDDDTLNNGGNNGNKPVTALVKYHLDGTEDYQSAVNIKVVYTNKDGKNDTVFVDKLPWEKIITVDIPFSGMMKTLNTKKNDFVLSKRSYSIGFGGYAVFRYPADEIWQGTISTVSPITLSEDKVNAYIDEMIKKSKQYHVEVGM